MEYNRTFPDDDDSSRRRVISGYLKCPLDTLTSILILTVMVLPSSQISEPDLSLMAASAIALGGQCSVNKRKTEHDRASCESHVNV